MIKLLVSNETEKDRQGRISLKTIKEVSVDKCYGCGACENVCPKAAIKMKDTIGEGYLYPTIDTKACVNCGKCVSVCPAVNRIEHQTKNPTAVVIKTKPIIAENSSSAGIFKLLADYVLGRGGFVCGAVYDSKFNIIHKVSDDLEVIDSMRNSKYAQSNIADSYKKVKEILTKGNLVLFTGTPCQIAGLYGFLGKDYKNLITMGLICHGAPAPGMWRKYLDENYDVNDIVNINFRHKGNDGFWGSQHLKLDFADGHSEVYNNRENPFYTYFLENVGLRRSCYQCDYHVEPYACDFLVGDFWAADKLHKDWIDGNKMSVVLLNSKAAESIMNDIKNRTIMYTPIPTEDALVSNVRSVKRAIPAKRKVFYDLIKYNSFSDAVKKTFYPNKYDVLIFGPTFNRNFGAIMTYYALYQYLINQGYKTALYCNPKELKRTDIRAEFCKNRMNNIPLTPNKFVQYNWMADTILLGSDQVWNYPLFKGAFKNSFYLDFADNSSKKIAYASSFGFDYLTLYENDLDKYPLTNSLMKRFDYLSVRENHGVELAKREYNVDAPQVIDPVFLLNDSDYLSLTKDAKNVIKELYIVSYIIGQKGPTEEFNQLAEYTSEKLGLPLYAMLMGEGENFEKEKEISLGTVCENLSVEEWLNNIKNAEFVITNSFHCICFSIIFRKKFIILNNNWGVSRITSLLDSLGLRERHITSFEELKEKQYLLEDDIDWDSVYSRLNKMRDEGIQWLDNALKSSQRSFVKYKSEHDNSDSMITKTRNLPEYMAEIKANKEDYVLTAIAHGNNNIEEIGDYLLKKLKDNGLTRSMIEPENSILNISEDIYIKGLNRENQRYVDIHIMDKELKKLREANHETYMISFDWETTATSGRFKIQFGGEPWDSLSEFIEITPDITSGHYENLYITSKNVSKFETGILQVRMDGIEGELILSNLKMEKGNRVTEDSLKINGFGLITDFKEFASLSTTSMGRVEYEYGKEKFLIEYQNQGFRGLKPVSELYIEDSDRRFIYPCSAEGYYFFLYSKEKKCVVDIAFSDGEEKGLAITHF